jgi:anti-sigma B factor antagonist
VVGTSGNLRITITREEDTIVVALVGDLDVYVAADARHYLDEAIDRAVAHDVSRLSVDASALGFCDSTGLSIILRAGEAAAERGVNLSLRRLSAPVLALLKMTGLESLAEDDE